MTVISETLLRRFDLNGPRYTSYPTADRFGPEVEPVTYATALQRVTGPVSLYVHIPFCRSLCYYCACNKIVTKSNQVADDYLKDLERELELVTNQTGTLQISQIALGGGTPNFLSIEQLNRLLALIRDRHALHDDREQSIEIDPRYLQAGYMSALRSLGFNRVSFGVQDFDERVQSLIHRFQSFEQTRAAVDAARDANFESLSFDLVYGLPLQSRESFAATLERALSLDPDRVALFNYAHIPERFKAQRRIPTESLPHIDERVGLFLYATERLIDAGYVAIGLDHFAKPSDSLAKAMNERTLRRNFQGYTTHARTQLIGLGVSAISELDGVFAQNSPQLDVYHARLARGELATFRGIVLTRDDRIRARAIEQLMCHATLDWASLADVFAIKPQTYFEREIGRLESLAQDGIVELRDEGVHVTEAGRLLLRAVAMVFDAHRDRATVRANASTLDVRPVQFSRIA